MEAQEQIQLFYWMRLGAGVFVLIGGLLFVWSIFGPVREERPASMADEPQPAE